MKKILVLILVLPLCMSFIITAFAKTKNVRIGEILNVDDVAQTISVKGPEGIEVFDITEAMFDEDYGIEVIQPGDVVEI